MAEQVNQRVEHMINELEQMQRTELYTPDEIREISRKRKEFEYRIQRQFKQKEDFIHYIAYDMILLEDISLRRKKSGLKEKKDDIEFTIAKRLNKIFKLFIQRFQDDIEVYFQYIKFCKSVGFEHAISGIIGEMLQIYSDKPKMWQMASKWESEVQNNPANARDFLLKGIHRHPDSETLYLDLFNLELVLANKAGDNEAVKAKQIKRASIIWKNASRNITKLRFIFKLYDIAEKFKFTEDIIKEMREHIWSRHENEQDVWSFVAGKELKGQHWENVDEFVTENDSVPRKLNNFVCLYEEALQKFADETLCDRYIYDLLKASDDTCTPVELIQAVKRALRFGHDWRVLSDDMYSLWLDLLKAESELTTEEMMEILDAACQIKPQSRRLWEEIIILNKTNEKKMESYVEKANRHLKSEEMTQLWNVVLDNVDSKSTIKKLYSKVRNCDSAVLLSIKPKLLTRTYLLFGIKVTRQTYEEFLKTPPLQLDIHNLMIKYEMEQDVLNVKYIRKCYENAVHHFGTDDVNIWMKYIAFETANGNVKTVPSLHRRAIAALKPELVDKFIEKQTLGEMKVE